MLEEIESSIRQEKPNAVDGMLSVQKQALLHGTRMIECQYCTTLSTSLLLLSLMSEKLVVLSERAASSCRNIEMRSPSFRKAQKISLGGYEMESINEWGPVVNVLLFIQSTHLQSLLARLKNLAVTSGWQTHLLILVEAEKLMHSVSKAICATKNSTPQSRNEMA
jgi:hypothetical protein